MPPPTTATTLIPTTTEIQKEFWKYSVNVVVKICGGVVDVRMYGAIGSTNTGAVQGRRSGGHIRQGRTQTNLSLGLFSNQQGIQWPYVLVIYCYKFSFWIKNVVQLSENLRVPSVSYHITFNKSGSLCKKNDVMFGKLHLLVEDGIRVVLVVILLLFLALNKIKSKKIKLNI